jgi:hypothetical protein
MTGANAGRPPRLSTDQIAGMTPDDVGQSDPEAMNGSVPFGAESDGVGLGGPKGSDPVATTASGEDHFPSEDRRPGYKPVQLLAADEMQQMLQQWGQIQGEFVDEPRQAIHDADVLVVELMQRLARTFAEEREQLEAQLSSGTGVSTEDMRQGLRRYRSFFERLLAA